MDNASSTDRLDFAHSFRKMSIWENYQRTYIGGIRKEKLNNVLQYFGKGIRVLDYEFAHLNVKRNVESLK